MNKSMSFRRSAGMRPSYFFLSSLLLLQALSCFPGLPLRKTRRVAPADASEPNTRKYDAAVSGFGQVTGDSNGNSIREDTTESLGGS